MYSPDLRKRVVAFAKKKGVTQAKRLFGVNHQTIYNWMSRMEAHKTGPQGARKLDVAKLNKLLVERNDLYQDELAAMLGVHKSTICKALKRLDLSRKKNQGTPQGKYTRTTSLPRPH